MRNLPQLNSPARPACHQKKSSQLLNGAQIFTLTRVTFLSLHLSHPGFFRRHSETSLLFFRKVKDLENVNSVSGVLPSGLACRDQQQVRSSGGATRRKEFVESAMRAPQPVLADDAATFLGIQSLNGGEWESFPGRSTGGAIWHQVLATW